MQQMSDFSAYLLYKGFMWPKWVLLFLSSFTILEGLMITGYNKESNFYVVYKEPKHEIDDLDANCA